MAGKRSHNYFEELAELSAKCMKSSAVLKAALVHCQKADLFERSMTVEKETESAEGLHRVLNQSLLYAFVTPIDREDISLMAARLCEILQAIERCLGWLSGMGNVTPRPEALRIANVLCRCCTVLAELSRNLCKLKKEGTMVSSVHEVHRLVLEGETQCDKASYVLLSAKQDPLQMQLWFGFYERLSGCFTACNGALEQLWLILLKNG